MPGRTPHEAFQAFIEPLEAAIACLGAANITVSAGGRSDASDRVHAWTLNGMTGMAFTGGFYFTAQMNYRFAKVSRSEFRVTTVAYMYTLRRGGDELWSLHWHPDGNSPVKTPHIHLAGVDPSGHFPVERMSLEQAVAWVIQSGVTPARDDWQQVLEDSHKLHVKYRSWQ